MDHIRLSEEGAESFSPHEVRPPDHHALFRRFCGSAVRTRLLSRKFRPAIAAKRNADGDSASRLSTATASKDLAGRRQAGGGADDIEKRM